MPRVKRGVIHLKKRRTLKARAKGFLWGRKKNMKVMHTAVIKSGVQAYRGRKLKKRDMRGIQLVQMNAGLRDNGTTYSQFMGAAKKKGLVLDRKVMAVLASEYPAVFKELVAAVK